MTAPAGPLDYALTALVATFTDPHLAQRLGPQLPCRAANALAGSLELGKAPGAALQWRNAHLTTCRNSH